MCILQLSNFNWLLAPVTSHDVHNAHIDVAIRWFPVAQCSLEMERKQIFNRSEWKQFIIRVIMQHLESPKKSILFISICKVDIVAKSVSRQVGSSVENIPYVSRAQTTGGPFFDEYARLLFTNAEKIVIECGFPVNKRFPHLPCNSFQKWSSIIRSTSYEDF